MYFDFYFATIFFLILICCAVIVGFLYLKVTHKNDIKKQVLSAELDRKKTLYALKIKAIERFALYLERIKIDNLLTRIKPVSDNIEHYKLLLNATIEQEFNHNVIQKIYISKDLYQNIILVTQETMNYISNTEISEDKNKTIPHFRELLLSQNKTINNLNDNTSLLLKASLKIL